MKFLRLLAVFAAIGFILSSCQKVLDYGSPAGATGTLKATSGDCLPVTIYGTYQKDTLLNFSNTVDVQINVTEIGAYTIKTDTINGYSFSATGYAGVVGSNTVHLQASGRPILPEVDVFTVKFDTSICQINIIVTGPGGVTPPPPPTDDSIHVSFDAGATFTNFNVNDSAFFDNSTGFAGYDIKGRNAAGDSVEFVVAVPGTVFTPSTTFYNVNQPPTTAVVYGDYADFLNTIGDFSAQTTGTNPTPYFSIDATSGSTAAGGKVVGNFMGALFKDGTGPGIQTIQGNYSVHLY
jgi:hypothetical protein